MASAYDMLQHLIDGLKFVLHPLFFLYSFVRISLFCRIIVCSLNINIAYDGTIKDTEMHFANMFLFYIINIFFYLYNKELCEHSYVRVYVYVCVETQSGLIKTILESIEKQNFGSFFYFESLFE